MSRDRENGSDLPRVFGGTRKSSWSKGAGNGVSKSRKVKPVDTKTRLLPDKEALKYVATTIRLRQWMVNELVRISEVSGFSRNEVIEYCVKLGIKTYREDKGEPPIPEDLMGTP